MHAPGAAPLKIQSGNNGSRLRRCWSHAASAGQEKFLRLAESAGPIWSLRTAICSFGSIADCRVDWSCTDHLVVRRPALAGRLEAQPGNRGHGSSFESLRTRGQRPRSPP
jgi:hypothetical protein